MVIISLNHHPGLCSFTCTRARSFDVRGHDDFDGIRFYNRFICVGVDINIYVLLTGGLICTSLFKS